MLCSSVHTTEYKFNRSVTVVTVTVLTSSMLYNNLLQDIMSHDRTWFCQISKYRTSGFPWQAEFDTCNAKPFQLLLHAWHYWMPRVVTHILCQGGGLKKCLLSKLQGSAFTRTGTIVTVTVTRSTIMLLFHPDCKQHVCYPCRICLNRCVTAVIVTGHHDCIMPLQNSVAATKQQPQACPDNRAGL